MSSPRRRLPVFLSLVFLILQAGPLQAGEGGPREVEFAKVNGVSLMLDLHLPAAGTRQRPPLLLYIHGGAWRGGSRKEMPLGKLVEAGFAVASVDYRLSTEDPFPAQIHDIKAAVRFLRARGGDYGVDAHSIAVVGASAGGHLAALTGLSNGVKELEGTVGPEHSAESSAVQGAISLYGVSDLRTILSQSTPAGIAFRRPALELLLGGDPAAKPDLARLASPVSHTDAGDPPLLLFHGDADPQMPCAQSEELERACRSAGSSVQLEVIPDAGHGGAEFYDEKRIGRMVDFLSGLATPPARKAPEPPVKTPDLPGLAYGAHPHQNMDIYLPVPAAGPHAAPAPVFIWFGGIWQSTKSLPDLERFTSAGIAVVSVATRTLGDGMRDQEKAPVSYLGKDACRALQFVRLHAAEWGLDPRRIALGGSSQGALPALFAGCSADRARPDSRDPVERESTGVVCVAAYRSQPSIDPLRLQQWIPGLEWGSPSLGCGFQESLKRREELLPVIRAWSPEWRLHPGGPPVFFENNWGPVPPEGVTLEDHRVHSPVLALGFQELARKAGVTCYVSFPGHPEPAYRDIWDFVEKSLKTAPQ